jgi:hypothetical protein
MYRARFPRIEAVILTETSAILPLLPPTALIVTRKVFDALYEHARGPGRPPARRSKKNRVYAVTVWSLIEEALKKSPMTSANLFKYVGGKGKVTTQSTVSSVLEAKRTAGLVNSPEQRGGTWSLK